jgi:hypothetical protein
VKTVEGGATISTSPKQSCDKLSGHGYEYEASDDLAMIDAAFAELNGWLAERDRGVAGGPLQPLLNRFVLRREWKVEPMAAFNAVLGIRRDAQPRPGKRRDARYVGTSP